MGRNIRRAAAVALTAAALSGSASLLTGVVPASAGPPSGPPAICARRPQVPAWLWRVVVQLLDLRCGPVGPGPTTTKTTRPTTSTTLVPTTTRLPTTTTERVPTTSDSKLYGTVRLITCEGTPDAPVGCGPAVATAGHVRVSDTPTLIATDAEGRFGVFRRAVNPVLGIQAVLPAPAGRILDCPVTQVQLRLGPGAGFDPTCRSFPAI